MTFFIPMGSAQIPVSFEYQDTLPVFYVNWNKEADKDIPYGKRAKAIEAAEKAALIQLAKMDTAMSDWALAVLEIATVILILVRLSGDGSIRIPGQSPETIHFITYSGVLQANKMTEVMMYMPESHYLKATESLFQLAAELVNVHILKDLYEEEEDNLQAFYESLVAPLKEISIEEATREEIQNALLYGEWYKDLYGEFPSQ